ncbi:unnamed protein product [Rotaria sp. Silwood1]|nr:unnamed protein product [Rotaria sp. Silwood1]CAF1678107.1 unnamed protein product [Rotaria sp. Silwood1]CAF3819557.1 unnamed protein product [Rotaria sp. Silwood1]CAF4838823.1 unnamed protein product [Rotaria sp. Silwood1]
MLNYSIKIIGSLLVPLILAIFTVVITFEQRNETSIQRREDRYRANLQREHDLNISAEQRELDKWIAQEQRKNDKLLADEKRMADDINADRQRNMSRDQHLHDLDIEQQRYEQEREKYLDALLLSYYNEIGILLEKSNGSLTMKPTIAAVARARSLNVIRQVGPRRSLQLLKFLYDAEQLTVGNNPLDLSTAYLNEIDFTRTSMNKVSLHGVDIVNGTFANRHLDSWDLTESNLTGAIFSGCSLNNMYFYKTTLIKANFSHTKLVSTTFNQSDLTDTTFVGVSGSEIMFNYVKLVRADFSNARIDEVGYTTSNLVNANFCQAKLVPSSFTMCNMTRTNLYGADLRYSKLVGTVLEYANLVRADLTNIDFGWVDLSYANLTDAKGLNEHSFDQVLSIHHAVLSNGTLGPKKPLLPLKNGEAQCNVSLHDNWIIEKGEIVVQPSSDSNESLNCIFTPNLSSSLPALMSQRFLIPSKYEVLLYGERAIAVIRAEMGMKTRCILGQYDENGYKLDAYEIFTDEDGETTNTVQKLHSDVYELEVTVEFEKNEEKSEVDSNMQQRWCDNIQINIQVHLGVPS